VCAKRTAVRGTGTGKRFQPNAKRPTAVQKEGIRRVWRRVGESGSDRRDVGIRRDHSVRPLVAMTAGDNWRIPRGELRGEIGGHHIIKPG